MGEDPKAIRGQTVINLLLNQPTIAGPPHKVPLEPGAGRGVAVPFESHT